MISELCKGVHCVDLGESFQTHIYLQNLASIQPLERALQSLAVLLIVNPHPATTARGNVILFVIGSR